MLKSLEIRNFRMLSDFKVERLGRVNLIVGKNNSGKSTVLEAIRIYAGNGRSKLLEEIAQGHDEKVDVMIDELVEPDTPARFQDYFTGRSFPEGEGEGIVIGEVNSENSLKMEHAFFVEREQLVTNSDGETEPQIVRTRVNKADVLEGIEGRLSRVLLVTANGRKTTIQLHGRTKLDSIFSSMFATSPSNPCAYVPTQFISMDEIAKEWDKIALSPNAALALDALRIIAPEVEDLVFVNKIFENKASANSAESKRTARVKLLGNDRPVSLGSMGDGMLRILQLILKVFPAAGGYLLIDEFENGLHFSVQAKVWALLFKLAEELNVQIFATTHSWDCIESFANVAVENTDIEGMLFRVGKSVRTSDGGRVIATVFDERKLSQLTQSDVEVR